MLAYQVLEHWGGRVDVVLTTHLLHAMECQHQTILQRAQIQSPGVVSPDLATPICPHFVAGGAVVVGVAVFPPVAPLILLLADLHSGVSYPLLLTP